MRRLVVEDRPLSCASFSRKEFQTAQYPVELVVQNAVSGNKSYMARIEALVALIPENVVQSLVAGTLTEIPDALFKRQRKSLTHVHMYDSGQLLRVFSWLESPFVSVTLEFVVGYYEHEIQEFIEAPKPFDAALTLKHCYGEYRLARRLNMPEFYLTHCDRFNAQIVDVDETMRSPSPLKTNVPGLEHRDALLQAAWIFHDERDGDLAVLRNVLSFLGLQIE